MFITFTYILLSNLGRIVTF